MADFTVFEIDRSVEKPVVCALFDQSGNEAQLAAKLFELGYFR